MKKISFYFAAVLMIGLALSINSCKKDKNIDADTSASADDAFAERIYNNVSNIADEAYSVETNSLKSTDGDRIYLGNCATITLDTLSTPHSLIIDFGEVNCLCNDGRYRRGKIIVSFTGRYRRPGSVMAHNFDEYYVNDNKVDGSKVVTNMGLNENGKMYYDVEVVGVIYKANNGGTLSWNSSLERVWEEGIYTRTLWDDVYLISGTASGIRANGNTWEREILNPLRKELGCRHFVSGTVEIRPENKAVRLLDFGSGECDNIATVIINGVVYTIILP